jgi:hypothetical protein
MSVNVNIDADDILVETTTEQVPVTVLDQTITIETTQQATSQDVIEETVTVKSVIENVIVSYTEVESVAVSTFRAISLLGNGVKVGDVRRLNFIDGTNTTVQVDEYGNIVINSTGGGGSGTVESVTGNVVNNTDPANPVVTADPLGSAAQAETDANAYTDSLFGPLDVRVTDLETALTEGNRFTSQPFYIWTGTGLTFNAIIPAYYIQGVRYDAVFDAKTHGVADPSLPRIDVVAVNTSNQVVIIPGTPAVNPVKETIDPLTQLEVTNVLIPAGATTPGGITNEIAYKDNNEWTVTSDNGTVDPDNTSGSFEGTKNIDVGAFTNGQVIDLTDGSLHNVSDFEKFFYYINLKATFANNTRLTLQLFNGTTAVSSIVAITSGTHNWLRTTINSWQQVVALMTEFSPFTGSQFDKLRFTLVGANTTGFKLDFIVFQTGSAGSSPLQNTLANILSDNGIASVDQPGDTFQAVGADGTLVTASGKIITVKGLPLVTASGTDTYTGTLTGFTVGAGKTIAVKIPNDNTGAATFNLNSSSAKAIKKTGGTEDVAAGDLKAGGVYIFHDDGTNWQVIGVGESSTGGGGQTLGAYFEGLGNTVVLVDSIVYTRAKSAMTISGWSIVAEGSSPTCTIDIFKIATGTTLPSASICASALPALATGNALKSTTLTGWTTSVSADDMLAFKVTACANATKIQIVLYP